MIFSFFTETFLVLFTFRAHPVFGYSGETYRWSPVLQFFLVGVDTRLRLLVRLHFPRSICVETGHRIPYDTRGVLSGEACTGKEDPRRVR